MRWTVAALLLALATPAAAETSLGDAITICRTTLYVDPEKGRAMFDALPDADKPAVAALCIAYAQGAGDTLTLLQRDTDQGLAI